MSRRNMILGLGLVLMVGLVYGLVLRALSGPPANRLLVAGDVRSVVRTISAPVISYPTISSTVQVPSDPGTGDTVIALTVAAHSNPLPSSLPSSTAGAPSTAQGTPVASGMLTRVYAQVGSYVTTGEVLAQFDTRQLDVGVTQAKLNAATTKNKVKVLRNTLDTILDNIDKVATGRAALATARVKLATAKSALVKAKAQLLTGQKQLLALKKQRPQLRAALAQLEQQAASFPPGHVPPPLQAQIAKIKMALASINPGLAKISAGLAKINAGFGQLATASATLATAKAQLSTASDALHTAKTQVTTARDSVKIIADSQHIFIALAEAKRDQAKIVSPVSGVVTQAASRNTVAVVGAPLFRIVPDQPALIDSYLAGEQLGRVHDGSLADITYDSAPGRVLHATLHTIDSAAPYPPTNFPTDLVHMTHTVKVTFQLDSGDAPPAGTPVDIAIHTD